MRLNLIVLYINWKSCIINWIAKFAIVKQFHAVLQIKKNQVVDLHLLNGL